MRFSDCSGVFWRNEDCRTVVLLLSSSGGKSNSLSPSRVVPPFFLQLQD